ncbi:MAG: hypothetical protein IPH12_06295 [Saprospirales bacterium]|nr:hypothetical protein [Saprospirales bacterium]
MRGGSWNNNPQNCRVANRNNDAPGNRNNNTGFRLANTGKYARNRRLYGRGGCGRFCPAACPAPDPEPSGGTNMSTPAAFGSPEASGRRPRRFFYAVVSA